jgi:DNA-binding response OmpR family regulator
MVDPAASTASAVLVVDDEPMVREVVERYLAREGFRVGTARDGHEALSKFREQRWDLVVLDLMLPAIDGLRIANEVRAVSDIPIIMLTARTEEVDRLVGFAAGADDYVTKPFSPRELVARVRAVLWRASRPPVIDDRAALHFGSLAIDPRRRSVQAAGRDVELTAKEFDLLHHLARNPGQVFTREQLMDAVWDYSAIGDAGTVTVHMRRLRAKLEEDPGRPRYLKTVWGVGYKFEG